MVMLVIVNMVGCSFIAEINVSTSLMKLIMILKRVTHVV